MKTMNKWLVAGLIGLSSAGVSMATTYLDLNTYDNADWNGHSLSYALKPTHSDSYTTPGGDRRLDLSAGTVNGSVTTRSGDVGISGSQMTFNWARTGAGVTQASMDLTASYMNIGPGGGGSELGGINIANYEGVVIDFQNWADSFWSTTLGQGGNSRFEVAANGIAISLKTHTLTSTFYWSDFGLTIDDILVNGLNLTINAYTVGSVYSSASFNEVVTSFKLFGPDQQGVPEPETVWMIVAVLASLAVTFRRQLMDLTGRFVKS